MYLSKATGGSNTSSRVRDSGHHCLTGSCLSVNNQALLCDSPELNLKTCHSSQLSHTNTPWGRRLTPSCLDALYQFMLVKVKGAQLCPTLWDPLDYIYSPWNSPDQNTGVGSLPLLQGSEPNEKGRWILISSFPCQLCSQESFLKPRELTSLVTDALTFIYFWLQTLSKAENSKIL